MGAHALLSPSSAKRWMACPPSALLEAQRPYTTSVYADEGTLAHRLAELLIKHKLGRVLTKAFKDELKEIEAHDLYAGEMYEHCENFAVFVLEKYNEVLAVTKDALLVTEEKIDLSKYIPDGFGTSDINIIGAGRLIVIDLKYGKGVSVSAVDNEQMKVYGLGSLCVMDGLYDIDTVEMVIYQPRIDNISSFEMTVGGLYQWGDQVLKPAAEKAYHGQGEFKTGDHCQFCKVRASCRALAEDSLKAAFSDFSGISDISGVEETKDPALLTPDEIATLLGVVGFVEKWADSLKKYALAEAIKGTVWPGWKIVEGKANRVYKGEWNAVNTLREMGLKDTEMLELVGITKLTKILGTADFNRIMTPYLYKPDGKPTLAPESDKRPAYSKLDRAKSDFNGITESDDL